MKDRFTFLWVYFIMAERTAGVDRLIWRRLTTHAPQGCGLESSCSEALRVRHEVCRITPSKPPSQSAH